MLPRFDITTENRITTVPKNIKTDRTIACEPMGNLPFQLAVDGYLKSRLRRVGIDLSDQSRNQEAARIGSIDGSLATIDLSMASDTLSINTVASLLPDDWFSILMKLRSPCYSGAFGSGVYEKFSSMGNGFTFTLETLIFWALAKAVGSVEPLVYGDDIIVESCISERLVRVLKFFGFATNNEKTFTKGPFRESCGADWYEGTNVRPIYHRGHPKNILEANVLTNGILAISLPCGEVWRLLRNASTHSHMVPFGADYSAGIICHPLDAFVSCTQYTDGWIATFKGHYSVEVDETECRDVRAYFLWCHKRYGKSGRKDDPTSIMRDRGLTLKDIANFLVREERPVATHEVKQSRLIIRNGHLVWNRPSAKVPLHIIVVGEYFSA